MEMKQIPDYPNYAVTRDGRVWSYKTKKFLKPRTNKSNIYEKVILYFNGVGISKYIGRLVFETFYEYEPEVLIYKDGNIYNNKLDNLAETSWSEVMKKNRSKQRNHKPGLTFIRVNPQTNEVKEVIYPCGTAHYHGAIKCCTNEQITHDGYLYFKPGDKEELVEEIKARIHSNKLSLVVMDRYNPFIPAVKSHNKKHEKYLGVLEKI